MQLTKKVLVVLLLASMLVGVVLGILFVQREVQHSGIVTLHRDFKIYKDYACTEELTSIDWSQYIQYRGESVNLTAYIRNEGEETVYVNWTVPNMPEGIQLRMFWSGYDPADEAPDSSFVLWSEGERETLPYNSGYQVIRAIRFELTILSDAPEGSFSFTEYFGGHDVES
ncbi:MAG: hypothetical protein DRJ03_21775 [Chloroflexi bacterium]|nr:MAG: hypothetical protein DRJ03_21775 [Chloroflexota bacterium]